VGHERPRRRPAVEVLEHRGLELEVAPLVEVRAQRLHDGGARADHRPRGRAHDQVEVPLAHPPLVREGHQLPGLVLVGLRQGAQGLRGEPPLRGEHGELAAAGGDHPAPDEQVVPEIHVGLERREGFRPHLPGGDHHLEGVALPVLEGREAQLAGVPQVHDAAGERDDVVGLLPGHQVAVRRPHLGDGAGDREGHRVGVDPGVEETLALGRPDADLFGLLVFTHPWDFTAGAWATPPRRRVSHVTPSIPLGVSGTLRGPAYEGERWTSIAVVRRAPRSPWCGTMEGKEERA